MKNIFKIFGIIALVAVIGFSMAACGDIFGTDVPVSGVELNKSSISLTVGGTETLTATVNPSDATNKTVGWSSSNINVATVTYGTVTAVAAGSAIITVTTADGGKTAQCTVTVTGSTTPTIQSLNGIWGFGNNGRQITINGSIGIVSSLGTASNTPLYTDAINKNYLKIGDQEFRNITSTGALTWSGQYLSITYNTSNPNVATGTNWVNCTFTISADGQTLTVTGPSGSGTLTRIGGYTLNGIWGFGDNGRQITINGSIGIVSSLGTASNTPLYTDAINKNYLKIGDQEFRNITSTGALTWSGQYLSITYNTSNPNVATGTNWVNCTFTISADGQTLTVTGPSGSGTLTRKQ